MRRRTGRKPEIRAAILAGGRASRYRGLPKGLLPLPDGTAILARTIRVVRESGIEYAFLVANDPEPYRPLGLEIIADRRPGLGPLGGIEAALHHCLGRCQGLLVLPCDLPGITVGVLSRLQAAFARQRPPVTVAEMPDGFWQPLCAIVRPDVLPAVTRALDAGRRGVYRLWRELGAVPELFPDPRPFFNINTPEDLARWAERQSDPARLDRSAVAPGITERPRVSS